MNTEYWKEGLEKERLSIIASGRRIDGNDDNDGDVYRIVFSRKEFPRKIINEACQR